MKNDKTKFEERLRAVEEKLQVLESRTIQQPLSRESFMYFYNQVRYCSVNKNQIAVRLVIHEMYSEALQNKILYPSENIAGEWFVIGEISPVPIHFEMLPCDYLIESRTFGNFSNSQNI
jgi:hypothetical protein